ncbi:MAG: zinc dependent phospholipase C family protein [Ruminococcus sp.]|nr:zinc dependent phospholipase C family protein [Ruminococcus sp.]
MRTIDHIAFSFEYAKDVLKIHGFLKFTGFVIGNIIPDYSYHTYHKNIGHNISTARKKLALAWLCEQQHGKGIIFYYRLGIAAHYICDSFTFPHNKQFHGNLTQHLRYEYMLHDAANEASFEPSGEIQLTFTSPNECMRYLELAHFAYTKYSKKSPREDLNWISTISSTILLSSLSFSSKHKATLCDILNKHKLIVQGK